MQTVLGNGDASGSSGDGGSSSGVVIGSVIGGLLLLVLTAGAVFYARSRTTQVKGLVPLDRILISDTVINCHRVVDSVMYPNPIYGQNSYANDHTSNYAFDNEATA